MKALVLEIKNGEAAVLKENGEIIRIKRECDVGDTIELSEHKKVLRFTPAMRRIAVAAAAVIIFATAGGSYYYTNVQAASFVTVEGEASLEYVLNRRNQVIAVNANNTEGEKIKTMMDENNMKRCSLTEALDFMKKAKSEIDGTETYSEDITIDIKAKGDKRQSILDDEAAGWMKENKAPELPKTESENKVQTQDQKPNINTNNEGTGNSIPDGSSKPGNDNDPSATTQKNDKNTENINNKNEAGTQNNNAPEANNRNEQNNDPSNNGTQNAEPKQNNSTSTSGEQKTPNTSEPLMQQAPNPNMSQGNAPEGTSPGNDRP